MQLPKDFQLFLIDAYAQAERRLHGLPAALDRRPGVRGIEVSEVVVPIERKKARFVFAGAEQVGRQTRAAAYHLQELDFRFDFLEEHQVHRIGDIHAGIQHVYAYGYLRQLVALAEVVDDRQRLIDLAVDEFAELVSQVVVLLMELLDDDLCLDVVFREDDGFADFVARVNFQAVLHEVIEHGADGSAVDVLRARRDYRMGHCFRVGVWIVWRIGGNVNLFDRFLLLIGEVVVGDAPAQAFGCLVKHVEAHKVAFVDGLLELVGVVGLAVHGLEDFVGAFRFFAARRGG